MYEEVKRQLEIEYEEGMKLKRTLKVIPRAEGKISGVEIEEQEIEKTETGSTALVDIGPWKLDNNQNILVDEKVYKKVEDKIIMSKEEMFITNRDYTRWQKFKIDPLQKLFEAFENLESRHIEIEVSHKLIILMNLLGYVMLISGPVLDYEYLQEETKNLGYEGDYDGLHVVDIYTTLVGSRASSLKCLVDIESLQSSYLQRTKEKEVRDLFIWWSKSEVSTGLRLETKEFVKERVVIVLACLFELSSERLPVIKNVDKLIENMNLFKDNYS